MTTQTLTTSFHGDRKMGGERQFDTPAKDKEGQIIGSLRIHENNGEIHFHDDKNGLKVAVASATMFDAWEKLSDGRLKKFRHKDTTNGTELRIEVIREKRKKRADLKDALFEVRRLKGGPANTDAEVSPEFQKFDQFIKG